MGERIKRSLPGETSGIDPRAVIQCLPVLPSYHKRIQKLVSDSNKESQRSSKKAETAIHILSGKDDATAETGIVTWFDRKKGEWVIEVLDS